MNTLKLKAVLVETASMLCILLFVYAAASKLLDFDTFQNQLGQSPLLSAYADVIVWTVPFSEIAIALLLAVPRWRIMGLYAFFSLMVMFTAYIVIILNFTSHVPCSCGGVLEAMGWKEHLVFNCLFVLLSSTALMVLSTQRRNTSMVLIILGITSALAVALLHWGSEKEMKRNNAFIRKYLPHPIEKVGDYGLRSDAYYLAGLDDGTAYLGNYNAPLVMTLVDTELGQMKEIRIAIDSMHLPYRKVAIAVHPPFFYLGDGTVPILFRGKTDNWKANVFSHKDAYFTGFIIADSAHIGITTRNASKRIALGVLGRAENKISLKLATELMGDRKGKNAFHNDGTLLWNDARQCFLYTYFYSNRYEVANSDLSLRATGKTIDTIGSPIIDVAHYSKDASYKLGARSITVNRQSATSGNYLYIHSDRLGRYEDGEVLRSASIIDVYSLLDNTYAFSFHLYHQSGKKLDGYLVHKHMLVALVGDRLWIYRLKPEYFKPGSNATNTAQYQELDRTPVENSRSLIK